MREAASRGFWVSSHAPIGYNRLMVQDGAKKRPTLEINPDTSRIVKRIFDMADAGRRTLDITHTLNSEGIASPRGKLWGTASVHNILRNETYTGTLLWGMKAKDNAEPVRVEKAFPPIISKAQFRRVNQQLRRRAPKISNPRRVGSSYLLSGLIKCKACNTPLNGRFAQSGKYAYYVCPSNINIRKDSCETPSISARRFEELVVGKIRSNILTVGNIRDLIKVVDERLDGATGDQRKRLETIESELADVLGRLDRLYDIVETTGMHVDDFKPRIRSLRERQERLESAAEGARAILAQRNSVLEDVETITAYAQDVRKFLQKSELTERRAFIETFVKEIELLPDNAVVRYTIPISQSTPKTEVLLGGRFGCDWIRSGGPIGWCAT